MAKPKVSKSSGNMVIANGQPLSRLTSATFDTDLNEDEIKEIGNEEVVERVAQTPTVPLSLETNEWASIRNLQFILANTGGVFTINSFDGPTCDINVLVEEDKVYKRTGHINAAVPVSLAWNFDVGGLATESINLEGDNFTWYLNSYKYARALDAIAGSFTASSFDVDVSPTGAAWPYSAIAYTGSVLAGVSNVGSGWFPLYVWADGIKEGYTASTLGFLATGLTGTSKVRVYASGTTTPFTFTNVAGATEVRALFVNTGTTITRVKDTPWGVTYLTGTEGAVGGVSKGMIDILFTTGASAAAYAFTAVTGTNFLRLQTCSVDVDLARATLTELGHDRAFSKELTLPVNVTVNFSTLSSDLAEFAKFTGLEFGTANELNVTQFIKTGNIKVAIFRAKDINRTLIGAGGGCKEIIISGLDITSQSFGLGVDENATQDFVGNASNLRITGNILTGPIWA